MATAPDWSEEDKKRRSLSRAQPLTAPEFALLPPRTRPDPRPGLVRDAQQYAANEAARLRSRGFVGAVADSAASTGKAVGAGVRDAYRGAEVGLDNALWGANAASRRPAPVAAAPVAAPAPAAGMFDNVESTARAPRQPLDRSNGLTRIVQTAPGVFTDAPEAQGEERYYNELGFRADTSFAAPRTGMASAGMTGPADWARAEQAAAIDPMTDAGHAAILASGTTSQGLMRDRLADAKRRFDLTAQHQRSSEEQTELEKAQLQAATQLEAAGIEATGRMGAAQTAAEAQRITAQLAATRAAREDQIYAGERASDPETAARFLQEYLGDAENLTPEQIIEMTIDPQNTRGGQSRAAVRQGLARATGNPNISPLQTRRAGPLQNLLDLRSPWSDAYATDGDLFTDTFDPAEALGVTNEQYELYRRMEAEAARRGR